MNDTLYTIGWALGTLGALALVLSLGRHLSSTTRTYVVDQIRDEQSRNRWLIAGLALIVLAASALVVA